LVDIVSTVEFKTYFQKEIKMFNFRSSKMFVVVLVVMILATSAYAFAATNTVPASKAGEGQAAISGYTVTAVTYTYSTANPSQISSVGFTIAPASTKASVSLVTGGTLQACVGTGPGPTWTAWTCAISGVSVTSADMLRVVSSD
jgi:hypothetical protein